MSWCGIAEELYIEVQHSDVSSSVNGEDVNYGMWYFLTQDPWQTFVFFKTLYFETLLVAGVLLL